MPRDTYYDFLGVDPEVSPEQIKSAYRDSIRSMHPDTVDRLSLEPAEWEARLAAARKVNEAYEVLRDPVRRATYDASIGRHGPSRLRVAARQWRSRLAQWSASRAAKPASPPRVGGAPSTARTKVAGALYHSRGGQWLVLVVVVIAIHFAVGYLVALDTIRGVLELVCFLVVVTVLARDGSPSPAYDALTMMVAIDRVVARAGGSASGALAHSVGRGASEIAGGTVEAMRSKDDDGDSGWTPPGGR